MNAGFRKELAKHIRQNIKWQQESVKRFVAGDDSALHDIAMASGNVQFASNWTNDWAVQFNLEEDYLEDEETGGQL